MYNAWICTLFSVTFTSGATESYLREKYVTYNIDIVYMKIIISVLNIMLIVNINCFELSWHEKVCHPSAFCKYLMQMKILSNSVPMQLSVYLLVPGTVCFLSVRCDNPSGRNSAPRDCRWWDCTWIKNAKNYGVSCTVFHTIKMPSYIRKYAKPNNFS
jgi:hypothetical protein